MYIGYFWKWGSLQGKGARSSSQGTGENTVDSLFSTHAFPLGLSCTWNSLQGLGSAEKTSPAIATGK